MEDVVEVMAEGLVGFKPPFAPEDIDRRQSWTNAVEICTTAISALTEGGWDLIDRNELELLRIKAQLAPKPPIMQTYGRAQADGYAPPSKPIDVPAYLGSNTIREGE